MATYPKDQFDDLPDDILRVGAHRGPKLKGRGWIGFAWSALATGVIVLVSVYLIGQSNGTNLFGGTDSTTASTSTPTAIPTAKPVTDPTKASVKKRKITITVLNGTQTDGLQSDAAKVLKAAKWKVGSKATSSSNEITTTVVYYANSKNEDVARGVAIALGVGSIRFSDAFQEGAPLTVVLGSDFADAQK